MNTPHQVIIKETAGCRIEHAPLAFGLPFPRGRFHNARELELLTDTGEALLSDFDATVLWPDNSIKWALVRTSVSLQAGQQLRVRADRRTQRLENVQCTPACVTDTGKQLQIKTKHGEFILDTGRFRLFEQVSINNETPAGSGHCHLHTVEHGRLEARITGYRYQTAPSASCPLSSRICLTGEFRTAKNQLVACLEATLTFYGESDTVECRITLHNPNAAVHADGRWDLGDPNSLLIRSFEIGLGLNGADSIDFRLEADHKWQQAVSSLSIYQESSGGEHWNSPTHKDRHNQVPYKLAGYEVIADEQPLDNGRRASPLLSIAGRHGRVNLFVKQFWQNCPKAIHVDHEQLTIGLFPARFPAGFELQAGEKKTHTFFLGFGERADSLAAYASPPQVILNPQWVEQTGVLAHFCSGSQEDALADIIAEGLHGDENFFAKREVIDEYGWRHFGEIYADHETDTYEGDSIFVSHYNNQYDPIYGFLRQYVLRGEHRWFELADDLAAHVTDIDIYHTQYDKEEYNGGLFWHTDHCLDAATCTHRSYSRHHDNDAYMDHVGGGGPGGQHCYSTGLLYHYLLTGNEQSRSAVFQLLQWISRVYEGSGTLFDIFLGIKNRHRADLKNLLTGKYPLDRGTGNYINALLDAFELTQEKQYLEKVEHIIRHTVHPQDDLAARNLHDVEANWYYTVFLQALCRYLHTKEDLDSLDRDFYYARDALLHYADWMATHEQPYLVKPEILEFPNHTWTAQDLRKVNLLYLAAYYTPDDGSPYLNKAREIYRYITRQLAQDPSRSYTRILAILMQNHGIVSTFEQCAPQRQFAARKDYPPPPRHNALSALRHVLAALFGALRHFSIKKEIRWLARRSHAVARLTGYRP